VLTIKDYFAGNPQTQTFTYDAADRLASAVASGGSGGIYPSETYAYNGTTGNLSNKAGMSLTYNAQVICNMQARTLPHAVSAAGGNTYTYDCNGNMIARIVGGQAYTLTYDAENHLTGVSGAATGTFVYDGDGARVKATLNGTTIVYLGNYVEWNDTTSSLIKYYYAGTARVALRGAALRYLLSDHLGSTTVSITGAGAYHSELRYKLWGETRYTDGSPPTRYQYTGQYSYTAEFGLYFYNARWYDPYLNRWTQPDSIIPETYHPLDWDRYSYARNNPVKYVDPDGHLPILPFLGILLFLATLPGDTGPYDVSTSTTEIGNAGLRMVDPVDWVYTAGECFSGDCSGIDIVLGLLPVVNGGLDDATDTVRALQGAQTAGRWIQHSEYMSDAARAYQRFISGKADDLVYEIGGYTFDGFDASQGILKEARDILLTLLMQLRMNLNHG